MTLAASITEDNAVVFTSENWNSNYCGNWGRKSWNTYTLILV